MPATLEALRGARESQQTFGVKKLETIVFHEEPLFTIPYEDLNHQILHAEVLGKRGHHIRVIKTLDPKSHPDFPHYRAFFYATRDAGEAFERANSIINNLEEGAMLFMNLKRASAGSFRPLLTINDGLTQEEVEKLHNHYLFKKGEDPMGPIFTNADGAQLLERKFEPFYKRVDRYLPGYKPPAPPAQPPQESYGYAAK